MPLYENRIHRSSSDGDRIEGVRLRAFIHNGTYYLANIDVYRDGMIECWDWVNFEGFKEKVRSGWVVTQPPEGAEVGIFPLGSFKITNGSFEVTSEELIKEVADVIDLLQGRPTASERCREAWANYRKFPSDTTKYTLRTAYDAIPRHYRDFVLQNQDTNDGPIRTVLYPEVELCRLAWERYEYRPCEKNKNALRVAYEAVPENERRDAVSNHHVDDTLIRQILYPDA